VQGRYISYIIVHIRPSGH